jgi:hypothetical protein
MNEIKQTTKLWSYRWSFARGWRWQLERECHIETSLQWLEVFKKDEPSIKFKLSKKRPIVCKQ